VEIAVVAAIIAILASVALPLAQVTMQRNREIELRRSLREIRTAIDKFKDAVDQNLVSPNETRSTEWGLRSSRDAPDAKSWGGQNVYDVYTTNGGKGLDGTDYRDW
jgi:general secretion pathway protein G